MSDSDFRPFESESESEKEQEKDESNSGKHVSGSKKLKSKAWDFFVKVPGKNGIAECRVCRLELSYRTSVSNLSKHVMRKHGSLWKVQHKEIDFPELVHFTQLCNWDSRVLCKLCDKSVPSFRLDLRKHLATKHPDVSLDNRTADDDNRKLIISEDGQIYEIEAKEDQPDVQNTDSLEMDAVYLDEYSDLITQEMVKPRRKRKSSNLSRMQPSKKMRSISPQPPQEQILVQNTSSISSGLDLFCSYLSSLLKELPDRECKRLQAEFVHATVQAQLKCTPVLVTVPAPQYDTSIITNGRD